MLYTPQAVRDHFEAALDCSAERPPPSPNLTCGCVVGARARASRLGNILPDLVSDWLAGWLAGWVHQTCAAYDSAEAPASRPSPRLCFVHILSVSRSESAPRAGLSEARVASAEHDG